MRCTPRNLVRCDSATGRRSVSCASVVDAPPTPSTWSARSGRPRPSVRSETTHQSCVSSACGATSYSQRTVVAVRRSKGAAASRSSTSAAASMSTSSPRSSSCVATANAGGTSSSAARSSSPRPAAAARSAPAPTASVSSPAVYDAARRSAETRRAAAGVSRPRVVGVGSLRARRRSRPRVSSATRTCRRGVACSRSPHRR